MKLTRYARNSVLTLIVTVLALFTGTATSEAGDKGHKKHWKKHKHFHSYHNDRCHPRGAYYRYYAPRSYVYYNNHRGYWDESGGLRIFIRVP